jgi:hypothetical protein
MGQGRTNNFFFDRVDLFANFARYSAIFAVRMLSSKCAKVREVCLTGMLIQRAIERHL